MTRIVAIEISHHRLPLDPPFKASWDGRPRRHFDATIVRVHDSEGRTGIGSGDLMVGFEGNEELFIGQDPRHLERHYEVLSHIQFHGGRCWPLDLALWDLAGKITGEPVWRMLGGRADRVRLYASSGVLRDPGAMAGQAEHFLAAGFRAMKVRFTSSAGGRGGWREDLAALEAIRARVGDRMELMVDCNQGWRMPWDTSAPWTMKDALEVARALEPLDIHWMEEPLHRGDRRGMAALRAATPLRIAGGEMTRELHEFRDLIEGRCLDVLQPDVALVGGITGLRRVALMAREAGLTFTPHSWTNGIGVLANAHLAAGIGDVPFLEWPFDPPEWSPERRDYPLASPLRAEDGWLTLPHTPGLGLTLDEDRLAALAL
ncbi:mandelate racemase/muconate lactonizing enzyme family protein (plasmid) [Paroceanicella profunda]|uniref:Mandelate racemase/muconate lactonizing enzyme family protein n=1 Tax=Paroceanicella profunda TaxID=2579971 RepID=A0A5B8G2X1_9RHOB|nr:mandelate racemase/muconate lactonizing enzyme family protein [Paroceanicella profunda]QDL94454.1 mandelate racemase/muconate lactonizing enzyme family protein [Paroceanicella profunda]